MKTSQKLALMLSVPTLALMGCMDADGTRNNTGTGAAIGTLAGAVIGDIISKDENDTRGQLLGGAAGAIIGAAIGQQLDKQEAELRGAMGGSGAVITNTGDRLVVTLPEAITFPVDSTEVKSSLYGPLAALARNLNDYPNTIAQVVGHTDSTGDASYNQSLSERRASAVSQVLINNGVSYSRIQATGMGENAPVASNDNASGRQANRRVEINIIPTN